MTRSLISGKERRAPEGLLRVAPLMAIPAILREHGVDPDEVLAEFDIAPGVFEDPENTLPFATVAVSQANWYGVVESVATVRPSTRNSTRTTPTLALAVASIGKKNG